jgi:ribosome-binding factor A
LTEIVDRVEFMTGGSVAKVVVGFLEVRDEETYTKLASALAESSVLLGNTLLERH